MSDRAASSNGGGNRIFNDKTIAYWLASVAATVFGGLMIWQLQTSLDIRERLVRLETVVFPTSPFQRPQLGEKRP